MSFSSRLFSLSVLGRALALSCVSLTGIAQVHATDLPPVPDEIKEAGQLRAGVRCDQPPYGFQNGNGEFAAAAGLELDGSAFGLGTRSQRYAAILEDGVVRQLMVEPDPLAVTVSSVDTVLNAL